MAGEYQGEIVSGTTNYVVQRNPAGQVWNGSAFVTYGASARNAGAITLTEQGSSGWGVGDKPAGVTLTGTAPYPFTIHQQSGGSPAVADVAVGVGELLPTPVLSLADGSITDATFGWDAADAAGIPATTVGKLRRWVNEWFLPKSRNRRTNEETAFAADGSTVLHRRSIDSTTAEGDTIDTVTAESP